MRRGLAMVLLVFNIREGGGRQASHPNGQRLFSFSKSLDFYHAQGGGGEHCLVFNIREREAGRSVGFQSNGQRLPYRPASLSLSS